MNKAVEKVPNKKDSNKGMKKAKEQTPAPSETAAMQTIPVGMPVPKAS